MGIFIVGEDSGAASNTWATATELLDSASATGIICTVAYRIAVGGDGNPVATHTTERSNHIAINIPAAEWANDGTAPAISAIATGSSTTPNATGVTFGWSATHRTIFIAALFADDSAPPGPVTAWPTGYTDNRVENATATSAAFVASAVKPSSAASSPEDPGAFTMTGTETWGAVVIAVKGLALSTTLSPGAASISITGQTPTIVLGTRLTPAAASVAVTGSTPTIVSGASLSPAAASISVTGSTPTILVSDNKTAAPAAASVAVTGQTPTIAVSDHKTLSPAATSIAVTGSTPTVTASDHKVAAPAGAGIAVSTSTPTVSISDNRTVAPSAATIAVTGSTPVVSVGNANVVSPTAASIAITAFAPTVVVSDHKLVSPTPASIAITAFAPDVIVTEHKTVFPAAAAINITGQAPSVSVSDHRVVAPLAALIAMTGQQPTVQVSGGQGNPQPGPMVVTSLRANQPVVVLSGSRRDEVRLG